MTQSAFHPCDGVLIVAPDGPPAWLDAVQSYADAVLSSETVETVVFRGRNVALWAAVRRLHLRGARRVAVVDIVPGPAGLPAPHSVEALCERCMEAIVHGGRDHDCPREETP